MSVHQTYPVQSKLSRGLADYFRKQALDNAFPPHLAGKDISLLHNRFLASRGQGELLTFRDGPEYTVINERGSSDYIIICDHSSNGVPERLNRLGLDDAELSRHIGVDIGTATAGLYLQRKLDAPAIFAGFSRLVLDLNRGHDNPEQIAEVSDGTKIPGNINIASADKQTRREALYDTYHGKLSEMLDTREQTGRTPILVFVHSCTPEMGGVQRPWEIGILWNQNRELSKILIEELQAERPDFNIGDNEPYSLLNPPPGNSIEKHAEIRGLPHIVVEFRQDMMDTPEKAKEMAHLFMTCMEKAVEKYERASYGKKALRHRQNQRIHRKH